MPPLSVGAGLAAFIGAAALLGALVDQPSGLVAPAERMSPLAAVTFLAFGLSAVAIDRGRSRVVAIAARAIAIIAVLIALASLLQTTLLVQARGDEWMLPATSLSLTLLGTGLLAVRTRTLHRYVPVLVAIPLFSASLNLLDRLFGTDAAGILETYTQMSAFAAAATLVVGLALLAAMPRGGPFAVLHRRGVAGIIARRLLVVALVIPLLIGWLRLAGERAGLFDTAFGVSLTTLTTIVLFGGAVFWTTSTIARLETDRREARQRLQALTAELERSNRELQDFASVASHDLQEPLRKIQAFSDRLAASHAGQLDEAGLDYLSRMASAAARMRVLIDDLLDYSRVATRAQTPVPVELPRVVAEVLADLETTIQATSAIIEVAALPTIEAEPVQVRQVFQNLIGNAIKFVAPGTRPRIRIWAEPAPDTDAGSDHVSAWTIHVEDNGIGFEEQYLDRIFAPFQRLHGRNEYEGTGMGLAICRRIAERHGGTITARSAPGAGTTFMVTLPERPPADITPPALTAEEQR